MRTEIEKEFGIAYRNRANKVAAGDGGVGFLHWIEAVQQKRESLVQIIILCWGKLMNWDEMLGRNCELVMKIAGIENEP